ncbi:MAG: 2-amino-4-hydroxy-6-hydroxymethyldihydropteridine diphosphokinase [Candidatus Bipolaricaulaceae bacterium]
MAKAYLGLGANLPPERERLRSALARLGQCGVHVERVSSLYRTEPWGRTDQPWFTNMVVEIRTELSPQALLDLCKQVERELGRQRGDRWGPREVDIDILLYDQLVVTGPDLTVPHPRMHQRRFVLAPLCELAPQVRHPLSGRTAAELLADLPDERRVVRLRETIC